MHKDFKNPLEFLLENRQVSLYSMADRNPRKTLLLAAASYFEGRLTSIVIEFAHRET